MNILEIQHIVHQNAKDHGWWDEPREIDELLALIHSEISEALECIRENKLTTALSSFSEDAKPEGLPSEIADIVIRILDMAAGCDIDVALAYEKRLEYIAFHLTTSGYLCAMHHAITTAWLSSYNTASMASGLALALRICDRFCTIYSINLEAEIMMNHEYNKTRPYRHGGKAL